MDNKNNYKLNFLDRLNILINKKKYLDQIKKSIAMPKALRENPMIGLTIAPNIFEKYPIHVQYGVLKSGAFNIEMFCSNLDQIVNKIAYFINNGYINALDEIKINTTLNDEFYKVLFNRVKTEYKGIIFKKTSIEAKTDLVFNEMEYIDFIDEIEMDVILNNIVKRDIQKILKIPIDYQKKIINNMSKEKIKTIINELDISLLISMLEKDNFLACYVTQKRLLEVIKMDNSFVYKIPRLLLDDYSKDAEFLHQISIIDKQYVKNRDFSIDEFDPKTFEKISINTPVLINALPNCYYSKSLVNYRQYIINMDLRKIIYFLEINPNFSILLAEIKMDPKKFLHLFHEMFGDNLYNAYKDRIMEIINSDQYPNDLLKVFFDKQIMSKCSTQLIENYFENIDKKEYFYQIIETAYGKDALEIVKSRKNLDFINISFLNVLSLTNDFSVGFIHDCISYNFKNYNEFLQIIKNTSRKELFKKYYAIISKILGSNTETMQKAFSEFSYNEKLLQNIENVNLSEQEQFNLLNVLLSEKNFFNINTYDELKKFNEISKQQFIESIHAANEFEIAGKDGESVLETLKKYIINNLFSIGYSKGTFFGGKNIKRLDELYDIFNQNGIELDIDERNFLDILEIIYREEDYEKLIQLSLQISSVDRNYICIGKLLNKLMNEEIKKLNDKLTTIDRLEEVIDSEKDKPQEEKSVYKVIEEGVEVYYLNGIEFNFFSHNISGSNNDATNNGNIDTNVLYYYEGQDGRSTISTRIFSSKSFDIFTPYSGDYIYAPINSVIVGNSDGRCYDAHASHLYKSPLSGASVDFPASKIELIKDFDNEVAFFRRERDHEKITNDNNGGRINPIALFDCALYDTARKYGLPIIRFNRDKYIKKPQVTMEEEVITQTSSSKKF